MTTINSKVRVLRELNHLSQEEMANKLGMSTNGYAKIERGQRRLDLPKLEQIAQVFGMDLVDLLEFDDKNMVCVINENQFHSTVCLVNKHTVNTPNHNHYNDSQALNSEIEKLQLMLAHKDEMLVQKEKELNHLLEQKEKEIALLHDLIQALKQNLSVST